MIIKRIFTLILGISLITGIHAQSLEITPYGGYMLGGKLRAYDGEVKVGDGGSWGMALSYGVGAGTYVELMYNMLDSDAQITRYGFFDAETLFDMSTQYFQLGVLQEVSQENIRPFASASIGATLFHPKTDEFGDLWRYSATLGLGVKAYLSERIGIRLQGRLMMPFFFGGGGIWCGPAGCSTSLIAPIGLAQGDFSGGIFIKLK